jgi:hypothetical protein
MWSANRPAMPAHIIPALSLRARIPQPLEPSSKSLPAKQAQLPSPSARPAPKTAERASSSSSARLRKASETVCTARVAVGGTRTRLATCYRGPPHTDPGLDRIVARAISPSDTDTVQPGLIPCPWMRACVPLPLTLLLTSCFVAVDRGGDCHFDWEQVRAICLV